MSAINSFLGLKPYPHNGNSFGGVNKPTSKAQSVASQLNQPASSASSKSGHSMMGAASMSDITPITAAMTLLSLGNTGTTPMAKPAQAITQPPPAPSVAPVAVANANNEANQKYSNYLSTFAQESQQPTTLEGSCLTFYKILRLEKEIQEKSSNNQLKMQAKDLSAKMQEKFIYQHNIFCSVVKQFKDTPLNSVDRYILNDSLTKIAFLANGLYTNQNLIAFPHFAAIISSLRNAELFLKTKLGVIAS